MAPNQSSAPLRACFSPRLNQKGKGTSSGSTNGTSVDDILETALRHSCVRGSSVVRLGLSDGSDGNGG